MTDTRLIRPAPGRRVRLPGAGKGPGRVLAEAGETVAWGSYWQRLLQDGDIQEGPFDRPMTFPASASEKAS